MHRRSTLGIHRTVTGAGILLLLGVIINIVVAWACALLIRVERPNVFPDQTEFLTAEGAACWIGYRLVRVGAVRYVYERLAIDAPFWKAADILTVPVRPKEFPRWSRARDRSIATAQDGNAASAAGNPVGDLLVEDARGWPMLCVHCEHVVSFAKDGKTLFVSSVINGIPLDLGANGPQPPGTFAIRPRFFYSQALPFIPIWPGFAINTIVYSAILWLLVAVPGMLRRRRRIRADLCPACAYPIGASPVCTECGRALSKHTGARTS